MRKKLLTLGMLILCASGMAQTSIAEMPFSNANLSPDMRANDLLNRLTLEEKVALIQNNSAGIPRLGIKPYEWWNEALHGVARAGLATVFPQTIGMAASFDDENVYRVFDVVSDEARAKHKHYAEQNQYRRYQGLTFWTPNINIFRDPRWGRGQETYGEDPYLTSQMGMAVVRGLQGSNDTKYNKAHACAKHFAIHSGPEWCRHSFDANDVSARDLRETYLPAFKALVQKADVKEVMCAYNAYNGEPCCGSDRLLSQILRNEWGYNGLVVSDCWAINDFYEEGHHHTHANAAEASADAVMSGTDIECGSSFQALVDAVKKGIIEESSVDIAVRRALKARFELGLMDAGDPFNIPYSTVASAEHAQVALEIARKSIVLLQNKNNALPISKKMTVAVVGPNANDTILFWGNYNGTPKHTTSLLKAIQNKLPQANVIYEPLCGLTDEKIYLSLWKSCTANGKTGFSATYWNNKDMSGASVATATEETPMQLNTGVTSFAPNVNTTNFSGEYKSTFKPDHAGKAIFKITQNGVLEIVINGQSAATINKSVFAQNAYEFNFEKGKEYAITLKFKSERPYSNLDVDILEEYVADLKAVLKKLKKADVIVYAGGISPRLEGEEMKVEIKGFKGGDRTDIELPDIQRNMVAELAKLKKKIVFVNFSGSAVGLEPESKVCSAIVQAWYPGQEGGTAIADVLFGDYNPAGRLPITFYSSVKQLPDFLDYSMRGRTYRYMTEKPLFCFGHGLSYTNFAYGKVEFEKPAICYGDNAVLNVELTNTGSRDGEEVIQVYISRPDDNEGPSKALRAFKRVKLAKGETKTIKIDMPYESFEWFDTKAEKMRPQQGKYTIMVGGTSDSNLLKTIQIELE